MAIFNVAVPDELAVKMPSREGGVSYGPLVEALLAEQLRIQNMLDFEWEIIERRTDFLRCQEVFMVDIRECE